MTEKNEIEEERKGNHLVDMKDTDGQDPSGSKTKKSVNQIFDEEFKDLDNSSFKSCTIFKVNVWQRESNPDAYTPKMVSIGPYHKKKSQLDPMKNYKLSYLRRFLKRKEGLDVESCINELEKQKGKAIKCYEDIEDLDTDEFCRMLLLDGCFVVEFIREYHRIYPQGEEIIIKINSHYIFRDLMLLENQLPFFVLDKLHHMTKGDDELPMAILVGISFPCFFDLPETALISFVETGGCDNIKHLLHLVHKLSCHGNNEKQSENKDDSMWQTLVHKLSCCKKKSQMEHRVMPNATVLSEAGVKFRNINSKESNFTSLFDIKFEKGSMAIPCFKVEDGTETILRNLIAYEQPPFDAHPKHFSDFATFMDNLIESDKDVNLLRQKGIIENLIGEDKEVANLFNKIGKGVTMYPNFYYNEEFRKATEYCKTPCNKMIAIFKRNYCSTPWLVASTVAAIVLLLLTAVQTFLAFTGPVLS